MTANIYEFPAKPPQKPEIKTFTPQPGGSTWEIGAALIELGQQIQRGEWGALDEFVVVLGPQEAYGAEHISLDHVMLTGLHLSEDDSTNADLMQQSVDLLCRGINHWVRAAAALEKFERQKD